MRKISEGEYILYEWTDARTGKEVQIVYYPNLEIQYMSTFYRVKEIRYGDWSKDKTLGMMGNKLVEVLHEADLVEYPTRYDPRDIAILGGDPSL
jgi:hypothetical protein